MSYKTVILIFSVRKSSKNGRLPEEGKEKKLKIKKHPTNQKTKPKARTCWEMLVVL